MRNLSTKLNETFSFSLLALVCGLFVIFTKVADIEQLFLNTI